MWQAFSFDNEHEYRYTQDDGIPKVDAAHKPPRQLPNIWPDLRPKPPTKLMPEDEEYQGDIANKFKVRCLPSAHRPSARAKPKRGPSLS